MATWKALIEEVMMAWLGERAAEDDERMALKAKLDAEQRKTAVVFDTNSVWQEIPTRVKEWVNAEQVIAVLDAVAKIMKRSNGGVQAPCAASCARSPGTKC